MAMPPQLCYPHCLVFMALYCGCFKLLSLCLVRPNSLNSWIILFLVLSACASTVLTQPGRRFLYRPIFSLSWNRSNLLGAYNATYPRNLFIYFLIICLRVFYNRVKEPTIRKPLIVNLVQERVMSVQLYAVL